MNRLNWADMSNRSVGEFVDKLLFGGGIAAGIALWAFDLPLWIAVLVGASLSCGGPIFLHIRFPGLYITAAEKDEEFEQKRRFGKKR